MAMVKVDDSSLQAAHRQVGWLSFRADGHLELSLHSANEQGELLQWPRHDDSTINIVIGILIIV